MEPPQAAEYCTPVHNKIQPAAVLRKAVFPQKMSFVIL
jgi:hypothetical protein